MVMFVYREAYYLERLKPSDPKGVAYAEWFDKFDKVDGLAEVIIGKQRHGPIGTINLHFDAAITKFGNLAHDSRYDPH